MTPSMLSNPQPCTNPWLQSHKSNFESPFSALVFTSSTGIQSLHHVLTNAPTLIPNFDHTEELLLQEYISSLLTIPTFVVGEGTARTAEKLGFSSVFLPPCDFLAQNNIPSPQSSSSSSSSSHATKHHAVQLGHYLSSLYPHCSLYSSQQSPSASSRPLLLCTKPLLLLSSKIRQDTLTTILNQWNIPHHEVFCYDTIPNTSLWVEFSQLLPHLHQSPQSSTPSTFPSTSHPNHQSNFGVIYSPSGLTSIMAHITTIYQYLIANLQNNITNTATFFATPFNSLFTATLRTISMIKFIAIGATTRKSFISSQQIIEQYQHTLSQHLHLLPPCNSLSNPDDQNVHILIALFMKLNWNDIPCCISPSPQGVLDVIQECISASTSPLPHLDTQ